MCVPLIFGSGYSNRKIYFQVYSIFIHYITDSFIIPVQFVLCTIMLISRHCYTWIFDGLPIGSDELPIIVASVGGGVALLMLLVVLICTSTIRGIKANRKMPPLI